MPQPAGVDRVAIRVQVAPESRQIGSSMLGAVPGSLESPRSGRLPAGRALLLGALTAGVVDLLDALVFFGLRGVRPSRILQSIAAGVLGRASYQGGSGSAAL